MSETEIVEHSFVLRNGGESDLIISQVKAACGCTVAQLASDTVPAGAETQVSVKMSLRGLRGKQRKLVTVVSNDPDQPRFQLALEGTVTSPIILTPSQIIWGKVSQQEVGTRTLSLTVSDGQLVLPVQAVSSTHPNVEAALETVVEGRAYKIQVRLKPPLPPGNLRGQIRLTTADPERRTINIPVSAAVVGELAISPREIVVLSGAGQGLPDRNIIVASDEVKEFQIKSVEVPSEAAQVEIHPLGKGGFRIRISNLEASKSVDGKVVRIVTDAQSIPLIEIPILVVAAQATSTVKESIREQPTADEQ